MISLVIYGIIAIALAASAGYAFLTFTSTSRQTTQLQENQVRMETAAAAVRASLLALNSNGVLFPPMGQVVTGSYTQLPASLGVITSSPWGQPYLYCPVAQTTTNALSGTAATITSPSGATYSVTQYASASTQSLNYVVTTPSTGVVNGSTPTGYVAFIVSSLGPGQAVPDCQSVKITAAGGSNPYGGVSVTGGSVLGITAGFPFTQRVISSTDRAEFYVSATATTGNGTGQDVNNLTTLANALTLWQSLQPRSTIVYLEPGAGGAGYSYSGDLDAEDVRPYAQGEDAGLVIATDPAASSQASLAFTAPLTLTTRTTFQNVIITHASSGGIAITAYKPLTIRNASYTITGATQATFNIVNTQLNINDSSLSGIQIAGKNSGIEFYNYTNSSSSYPGSWVTGSNLRVSFDSALAGTVYTINNSNNATNPSALNLSTGLLNVSSNVTLALTTSLAPGIVLDNSHMDLFGVLSIAAADGGIYGAGRGGGIEDINGSALTIETGAKATVTNSSGLVDNAVFVGGSSITVNGTLTAGNVASANIGAEEGTITGSGLLVVPNNSAACVTFLDQGVGGGVVFAGIPLYVTAIGFPAPTVGFPNFATAKYGVPPMLAYSATNVLIDPQAAALLTTPSAATSGKDPYVPIATAPVTFPQTYYVDPTTFEAGVRSLVNSEFATGMHINFTGTCSSAS